jgi:hypothetical protein
MDACARDEIPDLPVLADYFGKALYSKDQQEDIMIIFGLYQGMYKTGVYQRSCSTTACCRTG